jgi:hypothetical protein
VEVGTTGEGADPASVLLVGVGSASHCGAGTTDDGAALGSVRLVGMGSASHCGGGHES